MRILIIEDEEKIAAFIKRGLKEEGYSVDSADNGEEGYAMAATRDHDLIILDIMVPKMDGISLCRRLRNENITMPILMLTAKYTVKDKVAGLDAGANDYLTKPFAFEELLARIRALSRKPGAYAITNLQAGDLLLDLLTHKVTRAGKEIDLTSKEYALLEYLVRNKGTVITRTMISENVWDEHFDSLTNIIEVYINYLRNKIDRGHENKLIHTLRGRGYVLKE